MKTANTFKSWDFAQAEPGPELAVNMFMLAA
jgi:hypothetical protein